MFSICITGHRPDKLFGYDIHGRKYDAIRHDIKKEVYQIILAHPEEKEVTVYSGMALGIDQIFVECMVDARRYYREHGVNFKIVATIPCQNQDKRWNSASQKEYKKLLNACDASVLVTDAPYAPRLMQVRNQYMVDHSDVVIAIWNGTAGGTANCVKYAASRGEKIIRVFC